MFQHLTVKGAAGSILWGYRAAAVLGSWTIAKRDGAWFLTATIQRAEAFMLRQKPLLFTAPRDKGFWAWGVESIVVEPNRVVAKLGPPEQ